MFNMVMCSHFRQDASRHELVADLIQVEGGTDSNSISNTMLPLTQQQAPLASVHDILIFLPARGDHVRRTSVQGECSATDRNCFAMVLLGITMTKGLGGLGRLRMLVPASVQPAEFEAAAKQMKLESEWQIIIQNMWTFKDSEELASQFRNFGRMAASASMSSMFLYGHGDGTRCKIILNGDNTTISSTQLANLIATSTCNIVHLMTCKASRLLTSMAGTSKAKGSLLNGSVLFLAYGDDDITTIPFQYAEGNYIIFVLKCTAEFNLTR